MDQTRPDDHDQDIIQIVDDNLRYGFAQVPRPVLKARGLSLKAKAVYIALLDYAWQAGSCFPGQHQLATDLDVSVDTIQRALGELKAFGLVAWERQGLNRPNIYFILRLSDNPHLDLGRSGDRKLRHQDTATRRHQKTATSGTKHTHRRTPKSYISSKKETLIPSERTESPMAPAWTREGAGRSDVVAVGTLLRDRLQPTPRIGGDAGADDREVIQAYLEDFARSLNDRAPLRSSTTRAINLYHAAGVSRDHFIQVLFQAKSITSERRRSVMGEGRERAVTNTMAYFFEIVTDLLGLTNAENQK